MDPNHGGGQDEENPQNLGGYCPDGQNWGISGEDFESPYQLLHIPDSSVPLDSIWPNQGVAGTVPHGASQGTSYEWNSLNGSHLQSWNVGNQSVAGTKQPAPGALEIADNEIQTLPSYDEELNEQQFNHLLADISGFLQLSPTHLGPPVASNSMDQLSPLPVSGTELLENQMPAGIQPLRQQQFGQAAEKELTRRDRKRASDRAYRERVKDKRQKLMDENQALRAQIQKLEDQLQKDQLQKEQQLREKQTKIEAEREYWKGKYLRLNERFENSEKRLREKKKAMKKHIKNSGKQREETEQVMMAKTVKETKNDD